MRSIKSKPSYWWTLTVLFNPLLGEKEVHTFSKNISPKVNEAWLELEPAYNDVVVQLVSLNSKSNFHNQQGNAKHFFNKYTINRIWLKF